VSLKWSARDRANQETGTGFADAKLSEIRSSHR